MALPPAEAGLSPVSSAKLAVRYIRQLIYDGYFTHGQRVPQDEIAQALGVSRIPVREALIELASRGWVTIEHNRGAFVNVFTDREVHDSYELYGAIGAFCLERALDRSGDAFVESLRTQVEAIKECQDRPAEFTARCRVFHDTVIGGAQSMRVSATVQALSDLVPGDFYAEVPAAKPHQLKGQAAVVRALERGDTAKAAQAYRTMFHRFGECVVELFRKRGLAE